MSEIERTKEKLQFKTPTQYRSQQTVATILEATEKIILREGFFGVTTDKAAKIAGVSVGSVYQFFGNKESIVSALISQLIKSDRITFFEATKDIESLAQNDRPKHVINSLIKTYSTNTKLRHKLQEVYHYLADPLELKALMDLYSSTLRYQMLPKAGLDRILVSEITVMSLTGLLERLVGLNPDFMEAEHTINEIRKMYCQYVTNEGMRG